MVMAAAAAAVAASAAAVAAAGAGHPTRSVDCSGSHPAKQHRGQVASVRCGARFRRGAAERCRDAAEGASAQRRAAAARAGEAPLILWRSVGRAWLCHASAILRLVVLLRVRTLTPACQPKRCPLPRSRALPIARVRQDVARIPPESRIKAPSLPPPQARC